MATILAIIALVPAPHVNTDALAMPRRPVCGHVCHVRRHWQRTVRPHEGWLRRLRWCESTNNPRAYNPAGPYYGLYQFDLSTWRSVGGSGLPSNATRLEQSYRAVRLLKRRGTAPWPVCGA